MKKYKILHIINNLEVGGGETVLLLLLKELRKYPDVDITLVSLEGHGPLEKKVLEAGIKYKKFNYHLFLPIVSRFDICFRFRLLVFALKERPDIIHGHLPRGENFAKVLGGLLSTPVVITRHDTLISPTRKQLFLDRFVSKIVGVSPAVKQHLEKEHNFPKGKVLVIPDAIDRDAFLNSEKIYDPKHPVFIYSGRLYKTKGIEHTIMALAKLQEEIPALKLLIFGKPVEQSELRKLEKLVADSGWNFVDFMGYTDNVPNALKQGDIFVLASKTEGFAMAPLEAATAGKPLILTRTGAMEEMVAEGKNGYFVSYGDVDGIYGAAKKILGGDVAEMGRYSREKISIKFDISKVAKMYYNLYLQIVKK